MTLSLHKRTLQFIMTHAFLTNFVALALIALGYALPEQHILTVGLYAFSGAITNWLAIHMLFEKIPFLYGSGVIPNRFKEFKLAIQSLIMEQFFTMENIERFFKGSVDAEIKNMNFEPLVESIDTDKVFTRLSEAIMSSSFGSMLSMFGGEKALTPLKEPFAEKLKTSLLEMTETPVFQHALLKQNQLLHPNRILEKVDNIVEQRLNELTPQMVKLIVKNMIEIHLGWLVIWGGVFGGLIGLVASFLAK